MRILCPIIFVMAPLVFSADFHCDIEAYHDTWRQALTEKAKSNLEVTYHDTALLYLDGETVKGRRLIAEALIGLDWASIEVTSHRMLNHQNKRYLEFSEISANGKKFYSVTGWYREMGVWKREMHIIAEKRDGMPNPEELNLARRNWVSFANKADVPALVRNLYATDTVYFSYGEIFRGQEALAEAYAYMGNDDYQVDLSFVTGGALGPDRAIEIGYYMANGGLGPYVLIWKQENGWKIEMDANY